MTEPVGNAICENGHPLEGGQSRCAACGARIKMQWMDRPAGDDPLVGDGEPAATEPRPGNRSSTPSIWVWFIVGLGLLLVGTIIASWGLAGYHAAEGTKVWIIVLILGGLLGTVGAGSIHVATTAKGVELGRDASSRAGNESGGAVAEEVGSFLRTPEAARMGSKREVASRVHQILTDHFSNVETYSANGYTLRKGSARAFVEIDSSAENSYTDAPTFVRITVPLLQQVSETPELHRHIAFGADTHRFGTLALKADEQHGTCIFFCHTLLGDYLDDDELGHALGGMLDDADDLDDELQQRFGGKRFHED